MQAQPVQPPPLPPSPPQAAVSAPGTAAGAAAAQHLLASPALDRPLPSELTGNPHGWLSRYRRYPVFSPAWAAGRARSLGLLVLALVLLMVLTPLLGTAPANAPWGAAAQIVLAVALPLFGGPWLGSLVRKRGWPPRREWGGLVATVLGLVLAVGVFNEFLAEALKQRIAQATGQVDAQGQRKRVALAVGVLVLPPAGGASQVQADVPSRKPAERGTDAWTHLSFAIGAFFFAGGAALPRWRREREGLAALERERELARAQAQRREAELRLSVLAAQVEPHFLFNTLAGVRSAISTDPARASEMIDKLVDYLRAAIPRLRSDGSAQATVGGQVEIVRAYLELMRARMPRLSVQVQVPPDLLQAHCPPLMLISLAENAVKHGVEPKIGPASIEVRAERSADGRLQLTVEDDGVGFGMAPGAGHAGSGLGLTNVRERLAQLYGERASLSLRTGSAGGVAASLTLPLDLPG